VDVFIYTFLFHSSYYSFLLFTFSYIIILKLSLIIIVSTMILTILIHIEHHIVGLPTITENFIPPLMFALFVSLQLIILVLLSLQLLNTYCTILFILLYYSHELC